MLKLKWKNRFGQPRALRMTLVGNCEAIQELVRQCKKEKKNRKTLPKITVINFKTSEPDVKQK